MMAQKTDQPEQQIFFGNDAPLHTLFQKQVAEVLCIPIGTVMSRVARARYRLRESLSLGGSSPQISDSSKNPRHPQHAQADEELVSI